MSSFLPPLTSAEQNVKKGQCLSPNDMQEKLKKKILIKLPPWEQNTRLKNWEPLNPPSPYQQAVQKRLYPSVITSLQAKRLVGTSSGSQLLAKPLLALENVNDKPSDNQAIMKAEEEESHRQRMIHEEMECRSTVVFNEQYRRTHIWVEMLRVLGELLETDVQAAEQNVRDACKRDDERFRMCCEIEMRTTLSRSQERFKTEMRKQMAELMPLYNEIRGRIIAEESEHLKSIFAWSKKNRPFGMRYPIDPDGPIRKIVKKRAPASPGNNTRNIKKKIIRTLPNTAQKETADSTSLDNFHESSCLEEGRKAWRALKDARGLARKEFTSMRDVEVKEGTTRDGIRCEEALAWMSITAMKVDEYYSSKQSELKREVDEVLLIEKQLQELKKREAIRLRLEIEAMKSAVPDVLDGTPLCTVSSLSDKTKEQKVGKSEEDGTGEKVTTGRRSLSDKRDINSQSTEEAREKGVSSQNPTDDKDDNNGFLWNDELTQRSLYPMLDMVLGVAFENNPQAILRSPLFAALGDEECVLAAVEGRDASAFTFATHLPLCPVYLSSVLWPVRREVVGDNAVFKAEATAREKLVREQAKTVWALYQEAARDAGRASKTESGEAYYLGVRLPEQYMEELQ